MAEHGVDANRFRAADAPRIRRNVTVHPEVWEAVQRTARLRQLSASRLLEHLALEHCRIYGTWDDKGLGGAFK